ncbi:hypothetical protein DSECCO2_539100 [anaerobic digester metagenome]
MGLADELVAGLCRLFIRRIVGAGPDGGRPRPIALRVVRGDLIAKPISHKSKGRPVAGARLEPEPDAERREVDTVPDRLRERCGPGYPPGPAVGDAALRVGRGEVAPETDHTGGHADAGPLGLERAAAGVVLLRRVAEQGEVRGVGARAYAGSDGVHDAADALRGEPVEDRGPCGGKRGLSIQHITGTVGYTVQYEEEHLLSNHQRLVRSGT